MIPLVPQWMLAHCRGRHFPRIVTPTKMFQGELNGDHHG